MNSFFDNEIYITSKADLQRWVSDQWKPCDPDSYSVDANSMITGITDYLWLSLHYNENWNTQKPLPNDINVFEIADYLEKNIQRVSE